MNTTTRSRINRIQVRVIERFSGKRWVVVLHVTARPGATVLRLSRGGLRGRRSERGGRCARELSAGQRGRPAPVWGLGGGDPHRGDDDVCPPHPRWRPAAMDNALVQEARHRIPEAAVAIAESLRTALERIGDFVARSTGS